jgi:hypothetical protein
MPHVSSQLKPDIRSIYRTTVETLRYYLFFAFSVRHGASGSTQSCPLTCLPVGSDIRGDCRQHSWNLLWTNGYQRAISLIQKKSTSRDPTRRKQNKNGIYNFTFAQKEPVALSLLPLSKSEPKPWVTTGFAFSVKHGASRPTQSCPSTYLPVGSDILEYRWQRSPHYVKTSNRSRCVWWTISNALDVSQTKLQAAPFNRKNTLFSSQVVKTES